MEIQLDPWQKEIMDYKGHILLGKGRRIGATHIFAKKAVEHLMVNHNPHPSSQIVCVSLTEDQAQLIIAFATLHARNKYSKFIGKGKDKPTLTRLILKVKGNRRILLARPVGNTGDAARGFEGQILMIDEASRMPRSFWVAAKPILMTTGGKIWMWSTFFGTEGYFWDSFELAWNRKDPKARFKAWHENSEDVMHNRPICESWTKEQREEAILFLEEEKKDMTEEEYAEEYLGIASAEMKRFYDDDWMEKVCTEEKNPMMKGRRFLGVDIGRMYDPSTFEDFCKVGKITYQVDHQQTTKTFTNETQDKIISLNISVNYIEIGIDAGSGALGVGVYDNLMTVGEIKGKLRAMNNRSIALDREGKKKQYLKQVDYYNNMKAMGYNGTLKLLKDDEVMASLRSVRWSYPKDETGLSKMKILGNNLHASEGMVRGAELAAKDKINKVWFDYI